MRLFDVSGCRCAVVRPGMNLTAYAARKKPFALCNASLYDMRSRVPVGTIIESGKLVHDDGNGYGFGVCDGMPDFGRPWDKAWTDYLTGYNAPVQHGVYIAPAFADPYVFACRLARLGVGRTREGKTVLVTEDFVTLEGFARAAIAAGVETLVNLDGGGSRHLWYDGKAVYASPRVPYNAIAFYRDGAPETPAPCADCTGDGRCGRWRG